MIDKRPSDALSVKDIDKLKPKEAPVNKARQLKNTTKWNKEQNLLVVLVEFNDVQLNYSDEDWENRIFAQTSKSLATYYKEATKDQLNILPAKEKYGKQDGIVRVKLDQNHPKASTSFDKVLPSLKDALEKIQDLVDLSEYDTNKNGKLEENELHIMSIFAGYEASSINLSPSVWGHHWSFQGQKIGYPVVNGVKVNSYTLFGERMVQKNSDPTKQYEYQSELGLIAHEFGHDLGLPDLYNSEKTIIEQEGKYVSVSDGDGLGKYSVMASGSWTHLEGENNGATPPHLDAYSKISLGIVAPKIVDKTQTVAINHISQEGFNVFRLETSNPQEYFLIENRQLVGHDKALETEVYSTEHKYKPIVASGGIAIYHVNEKYRRNISSSEQLVTLKEADEGILGYSKLKQPRYYSTNNYDGFYYKGMGGHGEQQQTSLTKTTIPSTAISDGTYPEFDIFVNSESASSMNVTFKGKAVSVTGVTVDPAEVTLTSGKTKQLTANVTPENADSKAVTWSSSNEEVASVSNTGVVTAKKAGTATIKVTTEEGRKTATATITVPPIQVIGISLVETKVELNTGLTKQLEAKIVPEDATNKKVTWKSSNGTVATVSNTGLVTAKNKGVSTITATTEDGNKTTTAQINVVDFKSKTIKFATQKFYLTKEASNTIQAKAYGQSNNWLKEVEVDYESADDSIISIKKENSKVSVIGKKVGKTTITAMALDGSNVKTTLEIEVLPEFGTTKETALELNPEIESDRVRVYTTQKGWVKFKASDRATYAVDLAVQSDTTGVKGTYYNEESRQIGNSATWVRRMGTGKSKNAYYKKNDYVYMDLDKTKADDTLYNFCISKDKNGQPDLLNKIVLNKNKLYMTKGTQQKITWSIDKTITHPPKTIISVKDNTIGEVDRNEIAGFENLSTQLTAKNVGKTTIMVEATDDFNTVIEEIEVEVLPEFGTTKETALELNSEIELNKIRVLTTQKGWVKVKVSDTAMYEVDLAVQSDTTGVKGTYYNEAGQQIGNSATWVSRSGTGKSKKAYYEKGDFMYLYLDKTKADDTHYFFSIGKSFTNVSPN